MRASVVAVPCVEASPDGGGKAAGLARGSDAFLAAGLEQQLGNLGIAVAGTHRTVLPHDRLSGDPIVSLGKMNALVAQAVRSSLAAGASPMLAGGTCSHLIGMLAGLQTGLAEAPRIGLVWLDAHGDFNTPRTSRSGMRGGMPVATAAGLCLAPWREKAGMTAPIPTNRIVMVDVRNLDADEATLLKTTDVTIARFGPNGNIDGIASAIQQLAERVDALYVHIDADILDAALQPNHPSVEPDGPDVKTTLAVLRVAFATGNVRAFGVVSVNPEGPLGAISLASGTELLLGGAALWAEFGG